MKTVYIERSAAAVRDGAWQEELDLAGGVDRFVVGIGPGSFAGVRSALAFAIGYAAGRKDCEVLGLPSPCALARDGAALAAVGDARRGLAWVALFDGLEILEPVFLVRQEELAGRIGAQFEVVSSDHARIGGLLEKAFGERYLGERLPTADGLERFARHSPESLVGNPLPLYLNPAVRT